MRENQGQSLRQSKELEALLLKLNGTPSETISAEEEIVDDELCYEEEDLIEEPLESMDSVEVDMDKSYAESGSLEASFFDADDSLGDVSSTIPVGSGSYARVPSGGFHLVFDSIKNACSNLVNRVKSLGTSNRAKNPETTETDEERRNRITRIAFLAAICLAIIGIIAMIATSDNNEQKQPEIAAQQPVAGNEDFAIVALDEPDDTMVFDGDDFIIPDFEDEVDVELAAALPAQNKVENKENKVEAKAEKIAADVKTEPVVAAADAPARLTEVRLYGRNDNVLATVSKGNSLKLKRSCVMREGPASRFGLVKEIPSGSTIQILTAVEDNWVLQDGGVWTKSGQTPRLGPGSQFAEATKGMKLPQPKSRVISASNWKYVQFGKIYGYVGPACFK